MVAELRSQIVPRRRGRIGAIEQGKAGRARARHPRKIAVPSQSGQQLTYIGDKRDRSLLKIVAR